MSKALLASVFALAAAVPTMAEDRFMERPVVEGKPVR